MNVRVTPKRAIAFAVAYFTLLPFAHADSDPLTLTAGETVTHDDNIFRAPAAGAMADTQADTRLRIDFDNTFGRDRLKAWGAADDARYRHNTQMDNVGYLLGGEFDWASLNQLSGKIGLDDNSSLYRAGVTGDQAFEGKSIVHTQHAFTRASLGSGTVIGFDGGVDFSSSKYSTAVLAPNDLNQTVADLGVSYAQSPSLRFSLIARRTSGKYPDFLPNPVQFHRNDLSLRSDWTSGGFSSVQAQVAYAQDAYSDAAAKRYWTGFLRGTWDVTGHITVAASFARDASQNFTGGVLAPASNAALPDGTTEPVSIVAQESLSLNDAADLAAHWQVTSKIEVNGSYLHVKRRYDNVLFGDGPPLNGSDTSSQYQVGLSYQLTRGIKTGCSRARATHAPGALLALGAGYVSNSYYCFAELAVK